ncbi:hypothetical protein [Candidatus Cardinium hertigii]|uniref:Uncharacterized protein n=1 Tax=Candidatus Cardinium hertigii TaxID=247481 RepID=A0A2Z3LDI2_9BACT|nr:hypothetical protein [Candidatus Cardinium hertigii]AWN82162.1 hypothetical protein DK880_00861 [Candidatus Cardinium hertigii]AWN82223.1 hypothetical protein DK880_00925 [Candidatus Cardinium hertigii]
MSLLLLSTIVLAGNYSKASIPDRNTTEQAKQQVQSAEKVKENNCAVCLEQMDAKKAKP